MTYHVYIVSYYIYFALCKVGLNGIWKIRSLKMNNIFLMDIEVFFDFNVECFLNNNNLIS